MHSLRSQCAFLTLRKIISGKSEEGPEKPTVCFEARMVLVLIQS